MDADKEPKEKRDWFGDIFLWSFAGTLVAVTLKSLFNVSFFLVALPIFVFWVMLCSCLLALIVTFILDMYASFRDALKPKKFNQKRRKR
jgi:hypothetical protein